MKGEGPAVDIARLIEATGGRLPVFNGRGGLEMIESLQAGCAGMVVAPDVIDRAVQIYESFRNGDLAAADEGYRRILPAITFVMQSIETFICYGKRVFAARAGFDVHDRAPALRPTPFGLDRVKEHSHPAWANECRQDLICLSLNGGMASLPSSFWYSVRLVVEVGERSWPCCGTAEGFAVLAVDWRQIPSLS